MFIMLWNSFITIFFGGIIKKAQSVSYNENLVKGTSEQRAQS